MQEEVSNVMTAPRMTALERQLLVVGKTRGELARDAGCTPQMMSLVVRGLVTPHPHKIRRFAVAFEVTPQRFVELLNEQ